MLIWPVIPYGLLIAFACSSLTRWPFIEVPNPSLFAGNSFTVDRSATALEILRLLGLGCCFGCGALIGRSIRSTNVVVTLIVWAGTTFVCTALIAGSLGWAPQTQANRTEGWFLNPNTAGTLCGALLCLSGPLSPRIDRSHLGWRSKLVGYAPFFASAILFTGLLLTRSRGALISTGLSLGGLVVLQGAIGRVKIKPILTSAAILLVLALIVVGIGGSVVDRVKTLAADANLRHFIFYVHWTNFLAHPLRGYGLGSFDTVNRMTLTSGTFADLWNIRAAENVYLQWLVEAGVIGSALMFSCIGIIVAVTVLGLKSSRTFSMLAIMLTVDSVFLIHGMFDFGLQTPSLELFWAFILGAQYSLATRISSRGTAQ